MIQLNNNTNQSPHFADWKAITDLIHGYALHIRRLNGSRCVELFTDDGVFEIRDAPLDGQTTATTRAKLEGRDAILQYLQHAEASGARVCPMLQNIIIDMHGDNAQASSVMTTTVWPSGNRLIGEYDDHFVRINGQWLFSYRTFNILGEFDA